MESRLNIILMCWKQNQRSLWPKTFCTRGVNCSSNISGLVTEKANYSEHLVLKKAYIEDQVQSTGNICRNEVQERISRCGVP